MDKRCEKKARPDFDGFDEGQENALRSRKKTGVEGTEVEKWRKVFGIIFPHVEENNIPSPCKCCHLESLHLTFCFSFLTGGIVWEPLTAAIIGAQKSDTLADFENYFLREEMPRLRRAASVELDLYLADAEKAILFKVI